MACWTGARSEDCLSTAEWQTSDMPLAVLFFHSFGISSFYTQFIGNPIMQCVYIYIYRYYLHEHGERYMMGPLV